MSKQNLGILSSYNELCGNASYTKALVDGLSEHFDVTVVSLNVELLRKGKSNEVKSYLKKIHDQLSQFDCLNIQFESGLFGTNPKIVWKRFNTIAGACKKVMLTMHRFDSKKNYPGIFYFGKCLLQCRFEYLYHSIVQTTAQNLYAGLYSRIVKFCIKKNIPILVHTQRDRDLIQTTFKYDQVYDHPLCFYDQEYIASISNNFSRTDFLNKLQLKNNKTYIGIFGFISKYKGYETIIKAMSFLPDNYQLLIFGGQHPHTIVMNESINEYIHHLVHLVEHLKLSSRIKFYGLLDDDAFLKALLHCDFNVLPYLEVNQGGSAIAALSLETNSNTIFSQNLAFSELAKYAPNSFKQSTIGNHLELANAIKSYKNSEFQSSLNEYHKKYNIRTSSALYHKLLTL